MSLFLDNAKYKNLIKDAEATKEALWNEEKELNREYSNFADKIIDKYDLQLKTKQPKEVFRKYTFNFVPSWVRYDKSHDIDRETQTNAALDDLLSDVPSREKTTIIRQLKTWAIKIGENDEKLNQIENTLADLYHVKRALQELNAVRVLFGDEEDRKEVANQVNSILDICFVSVEELK